MKPKTIKLPLLTLNKECLIDEDVLPLVGRYSWYYFYTDGKEYVDGYIKGIKGNYRKTFIHRLIMNCPKGLEIDHINGNGLDNRRANLRICTHQENLWNRKSLRNNTSGYHGVHCSNDGQRRKRWTATIRIGNGKRIILGRFFTKEEAALVYNHAAKKYHGEFATINSIYPAIDKKV